MRWCCVALVACGRVDFAPLAAAPDAAAPDAPAPDAACAFGPFGAPQRIAALASAGTDWGPTLSHDGLTVVFASDRNGAGDRLFYATRASTADPWPAATQLVEAGEVQDDPSLTTDELTAYWGGPGGVIVATRPTRSDPWTIFPPVLPNTAAYDVVGGPDIAPDQRSIAFTATAASDGQWHMYEATRADPSAAFGPGSDLFGAPAAFGSLRGDRLEAVWQTADMVLMHATRPTVGDPFGAAVPLTLTGGREGDPDLSDDGATLWFASDAAGSYDLWVATRTCE